MSDELYMVGPDDGAHGADGLTVLNAEPTPTVTYPPVDCPTCGNASGFGTQAGRQYEKDPPQPWRGWFTPCGHPMSREYCDAWIAQATANLA